MSFKLDALSPAQRRLRQTILAVSFAHRYPHLGSCLSMVEILLAIHQHKKTQDIFVLSNGHAAIAYYAVLEQLGILTRVDVEKLLVHPDAWPAKQIMVSSGSLGQGLPIAVGWALADRNRHVYCSISDGECMEGSIWEALRIAAEQKLFNLHVIVNANGWGAYRKVAVSFLKKEFTSLGFKVLPVDGHNLAEVKSALSQLENHDEARLQIIIAKTTVNQFPFLKEQAAHYYVMNAADYQLAEKLLDL